MSHQDQGKDGACGLFESYKKPIISGHFFSGEQCIMDHREPLLLILFFLVFAHLEKDMTV